MYRHIAAPGPFATGCLPRRSPFAADLHRLSQPPRYRRTQDYRRRDPVGDRNEPREPGPRRDRDRTAHASRTRRCQRALQRAARRAIKPPIDPAGGRSSSFVDNYKIGFPSELAILALFDPRTGAPKAILDASGITDMRTGAVTAIGAKHLARKNSKILGHIGARGTAYWNVRLLNHLFDFDEIRVHSRREESRNAFAERLSRDLGQAGSGDRRLAELRRRRRHRGRGLQASEPAPLLKTAWIKPGAFVVPYGTMSAVELSLTDIMTKLVVDDWGQCKGGKFGSLRAHVETGRLSEKTLHAELGQIVAGLKPGRQSEAETNLFWHRGLSLSDIALGHALLEKSKRLGIGQQLRFA